MATATSHRIMLAKAITADWGISMAVIGTGMGTIVIVHLPDNMGISAAGIATLAMDIGAVDIMEATAVDIITVDEKNVSGCNRKSARIVLASWV